MHYEHIACMSSVYGVKNFQPPPKVQANSLQVRSRSLSNAIFDIKPTSNNHSHHLCLAKVSAQCHSPSGSTSSAPMAGWTSAIFFRRAPGSWRFILQWTCWTSESISCEIMAHRPFFSVGLLNFSVLREKCIKIPLQILTCLVLPGLMTGLALGLAKKIMFSPLSLRTYGRKGKAKA